MEEGPNKEGGLLIRGPCDESEADDAERPMQGTAASVNPFLFLLVEVAVAFCAQGKVRHLGDDDQTKVQSAPKVVAYSLDPAGRDLLWDPVLLLLISTPRNNTKSNG